MSLQDIYNDLNNALHDGVIVLTPTTVPDLGLTLEAIGVGTLTLTGATLTLGPRSVVLIGNANYRDFAWSTTLTGESVSTGNRFTLALQGQDSATPWMIGTSFPDLPKSREITEKATVPEVDSVLLPLVVEQPLLSVTTEPPKPAKGFKPTFQGSLVLTDSKLAQYIDYFRSSNLNLTGTVDFRDPAKPVFVLHAAAPGAQIDIPIFKVSSAGIKLLSDANDIFSLQEDSVNSVAEVYLIISFGKAVPITAEITTPLLQGNFMWPMTAVFTEPVTAKTGFALILDFFGQPATNLNLFPFPLANQLLSNFGVKAVGVVIQPPIDGQDLALKEASIALTSVETWKPSLAFVTVRELGTAWTFHWETDHNWVTGNVWGKLTFFDDPTLQVAPLTDNCTSNKIELEISATLPDWIITARNESDICVPLGEVLKKYLGGSGGIPDNLRITNLFLQAIPPVQTYQASLMVEGLWATQVNLVKFSLDKAIGEIYVTQSKVFGSMTAMIGLAVMDNGAETTKATFNISAEYTQDGIWRFEGGLADGVLSLLDFAFALLGLKPAFELPEVLLTELWISYENSATSSTNNPYSARGTLEVRWQPEVLGLKLSAVASAFVQRREKQTAADDIILLHSPRRRDATNAQMIYVGELSGKFTINRLAVRLAVSFTDKEQVYIFEVTFGKVTVRAATEWVKNVTAKPPEGKHQILVITLRGFTLGDVVEYLVNLANPNANYQLEEPWTFLNKIDLSRFEARIDPTEQKISLTYRVNLSLGFGSVDTVGILYDRSSGEGKVKFIITGSLLTTRYDSANPLTWDAANDPPPAVPGKGVSLIDLRYLGAGQHVTLTGLTQFNSITAVIKKLREEMQPISDPKKNPLEQSKLRFDPSSQWMFGIDITVMSTVSVGIVLHDPDLYGLVLSLAGPSAGALAGLSFELLYKKVTDDIGVFRVRLQVPDAFRQINLGYVSITLGIITVDIFTNGNFMIDLGFPHNRDFTNSFGLEAGIFIGRGGLYFGVLNGATSTRVPKITNGNFSPVIELGIGLSLGVGRTFEKGPLKAGLYVQFVAIFEGVLAWFHPTDTSQPDKMYYWCQGTVGIIGKLYGSVDFKIIAISLSIEVWAFVTFTFASYRASLIELDIGVRVNASIKILFIKISFSFSLRLQTSFTIGSDSPTPWILDADQSGRTPRRLAANASVPRRRRSLHLTQWTREVYLRQRFGNDGARLRLTTGNVTYDLNWPTNVNVFPDGQIHPVAIKMLPSYLIDQVVVQWPNQPVQSNNDPAYRINFMLAADSAVPPHARTIAEEKKLTTTHLASADGVSDVAFNVMIEAMFRWSLAALGLDPVTGVVSLGQLEELARQLDLPETGTSLDMTTLGKFFTLNLEMRVSGVPTGKAADSSGTVFPIPPPLGWDSDPSGDQRRFATYQQIDSTYEREVKQFFARLDPQPAATQLANAHQVNAGDPTESMATFIFRDYFLLIAKASVQAALTTMGAFPYTVTGASSESLTSIARLFPPVSVPYIKREGDTVDQVADAFGMSASEILWLNPNLETELREAVPGQTIEVVIGATPESIASGNPSWPLKANVPINLGDVLHQVLDGETLDSIASKFGSNVDTWLQDPVLLAQWNLLLPRAAFTVPQSSFVNSRSLNLALVAAMFYVRNNGTDDLGLVQNGDVPLVEWYVQTIGTMNTIDFAGPLPESVLVPKEFDNLADPITWFTQPGDTAWTIAAMFAVYENQAGNAQFAEWLQAVLAVNPGFNPNSVLARVKIPEMATQVFAGEVLGSIATRFPIELPAPPPGQWLDRAASFRQVVKVATILAPLTPLTIPECQVTTATDQTISSFSEFYNLSLENSGTRIADVGGLLATWKDHTLTVPHPASAPIGSGTPTAADLVPVILRDYGASIAGQTSRFLVAGLRMPAPVLGSDDKYHATGPMSGIYELTGQQIPGPNPPASCDPPPPPTERLRITVKNYDPGATWLKLFDSSTFTDEMAPALTGEHVRLNPGLGRPNKRLVGLVTLTAPAEELVYSITDVDLCDNYPAPVLQQVFITPPRARPLFRDAPVRHPMQQQINWQTTESIAIPNPGNVTAPSTGMPSLWPFSGDLMRTEILYPTKPFALCSVDPQLGPTAEPQELTLYAWATTIDIRIRTIPGQSNTYEVFGADTAGRQLLLEVWQYLDRQTDAAAVHILYQESVSTGLPSGFTSVPVTDNATYLIKTNLTTETQSGANVAAFEGPPPFGDYYARVADSLRFLTLMWECSVVGGGGYWLQYTAATGAGLPQSIFSSDGSASLTLLILLASQMNSNAPDRKLHSFNDTALVGNSIDASASNVFVRVADLSEETREATVDPGNVAFFTALDNPPPQTDPPDKQIAVRQLYGMLSYQILATTAFVESTPSMPVGPQVPESEDEEKWDLYQVLPIWRYAQAHPLPHVDGLPSPDLDPYAGITGASSGGTWTLANTSVSLSFRDVYGNNSKLSGDEASGGPDLVNIDVGYTDPVIGIGAWPATTANFTVLPQQEGNGAILLASFSLQASTHLPAGMQRTSDSATTAAKQIEDFSKIYYQLAQSDVSYSLSTTLDTVGGNPQALPTSGSLLEFAAGACVWLNTTQRLANVYVNTALAPNLAAVSETYGVGYDGLAMANGHVPLSRIFTEPPLPPVPGVDFTIPVFAVFSDGSTIASITPVGGDPVQVLEDGENTSLLLHVGTELAIPPHNYTVPNDPPLPALPPSLTEITETNNITLASLIAANQHTQALLREGFVFTCEGVEVFITIEQPDVTLNDVALTFQDKGINFDAVMVAGANAILPGMFRAGAVLVIDHYIIKIDETLSDNGTGATVTQLAQLNTATVNLFHSGTAIYVKSLAASSAFNDTIDEASTMYALSPDQLLRFNRNVALAPAPVSPSDELYLAIPGHAALPSSAPSLRIPYSIPANATLDGIAALFFGASALSLAQANEQLPGVLGGGQSITVAGQTVNTTDGESFSQLLAAFDPAVTLEQVVAVIQATPGYLKSGALLLTPPAALASGAQTPLAVAERYGLTVNDFAVANSGLANIVVAGVKLVSPLGGEEPPEITTSASDTFVSFVWRFGQLGIQTTVADVLEKNRDRAFIAGDASILLAPAPAKLSAPFGANGWQFPQAIFDVQTFVEIKRQNALVDPAFRGTPAERNVASIPAVSRDNGTGEDAYLALQQFARDVKAAIPILRISTGKVLADDREQTSTDIWGIAFGSKYIENVTIQPGVTAGSEKIPQYFALRPLDNALVARNAVKIKPLEADGKLGVQQLTDFQGVDMETWAQRFLTDVDLFVSAPYAAAAYQTPKRQTLESVLESKQSLAAGIAAGLDYILNFGQPDPSRETPPPPDWTTAVEALRQRLLVSLSAGYNVDAVVQYNATVASPWTREYANFSGPGKLADDPVLNQMRTTLSNAKTPLATTAPGKPSYVNFLLAVAEEGRGSSVKLQLHYPINEVEFNIREIVDGYDASDWVTMVLNDDLPSQVSIDLGTPDVPLPVRSYPPLPTLLDQSATATHPTPSNYGEAMLWDYAFAYQHQSMAVDQIRLEVEFNQTPLLVAARALDDVDLFAALAQYDTVAPQLWDILKGLPNYASAPDKETIENAMGTFASLVATVATAWSSYWSSNVLVAQRKASALGPQPERYTFMQMLEATLDVDVEKWFYSSLYLKREFTQGPLGWPVMGVFVGDHFETMGDGVDTPKGRRYDFPAGVEAFNLLTLEMRFAQLEIANYQNASSQLQVVRNANLSDLAPTRPAFVYQTQWFAFPNLVSPLLSWRDPFPIGSWTTDPVTNPLTPLFNTLFGAATDNRTISCGIRYGYELATSPGGERIVPYLPVAFRPKFLYVPAPATGTVQQIITAVQTWYDQVLPVTTGGEWMIGLNLYSSVDGQMDRPLLELPVFSVIE